MFTAGPSVSLCRRGGEGQHVEDAAVRSHGGHHGKVFWHPGHQPRREDVMSRGLRLLSRCIPSSPEDHSGTEESKCGFSLPSRPETWWTLRMNLKIVNCIHPGSQNQSCWFQLLTSHVKFLFFIKEMWNPKIPLVWCQLLSNCGSLFGARFHVVINAIWSSTQKVLE